MKKQLTKTRFAVPVLTAMVLTACNGGGDLAGIGGSGFISTGTITRFGSVFVNGVEYETDQSTFNIEGVNGSQQDLRIGMVVQLSGNVNADGITGTATSIQYSNELQGPVADIQDLSPTEKSFTIMGQTVIITQADTAYEGIGFGSIVPGNVVEVSGFYDQNGELQASYLELKSINFDASSEVEVKGLISELSGTSFTVQDIAVDASSRLSVFEGFANGLQNGLLVEIKGTFDATANILRATEIEAEDDLYGDDDEVEVEGYITSYTDINNFEVNGVLVDASGVSPSLSLALGERIEVEGYIRNSVLIAEEIELRGGNAEISASVYSVDIPNNRFTLEVVSGEHVTVQISSLTRMEDDAEGSDDHLLLSELQAGDFVDVLGFEEGVNTVAATRVKREAEIKDTELQGVVTASSINSVTVLGVSFLLDIDTEFEANDMSLSSSDFLAALIDGETVISIEDKLPGDDNPVGTADSVEIED